MKNQATLQPEAQSWTRRYEQLREQVLAKDTVIGIDSRGLILLIRRGVAAWMRARHDPLSCRCVAELPAQSSPDALFSVQRVDWLNPAGLRTWEMAGQSPRARPSKLPIGLGRNRHLDPR